MSIVSIPLFSPFKFAYLSYWSYLSCLSPIIVWYLIQQGGIIAYTNLGQLLSLFFCSFSTSRKLFQWKYLSDTFYNLVIVGVAFLLPLVFVGILINEQLLGYPRLNIICYINSEPFASRFDGFYWIDTPMIIIIALTMIVLTINNLAVVYFNPVTSSKVAGK